MSTGSARPSTASTLPSACWRGVNRQEPAPADLPGPSRSARPFPTGPGGTGGSPVHRAQARQAGRFHPGAELEIPRTGVHRQGRARPGRQGRLASSSTAWTRWASISCRARPGCCCASSGPCFRNGRGIRPSRSDPRLRPKLVLSCRSHFFRSVQDELSFFYGEGREGVDARSYQPLLVLPFSDVQIRQYLVGVLGDEDKADEALGLISRIHNLPELACRPVLLEKIVPHLEQLRLLGQSVNAARLYDVLTDHWFSRDDGKHAISPRDKRELMERLAADLWRSGERSWSVTTLDDWLDSQLRTDERLSDLYGKTFEGGDRELLREDLRTSSHVVRQGEADFRFSHTSIQEYFLAAHLFRTAVSAKTDAWVMPMPSAETLGFLVEAALVNAREADRRRFVQFVSRLLQAGRVAGATEIAFRVALTAAGKGRSDIALNGLRLDGADLRGWTVGAEERRLNMAGASLRGADLRGGRLINLVLSGARLDGAMLAGAEVLDCDLDNAGLADADLTAGLWRACRTTGLRLRGRSPWQQPVDRLPRPGGPAVRPRRLQMGRQRGRGSVADGVDPGRLGSQWCPSSPARGRRTAGRLASGGADRTLRLWDASTGEELRRLEGHQGGRPDLRVVAGRPDPGLGRRRRDAEAVGCVHGGRAAAPGGSPGLGPRPARGRRTAGPWPRAETTGR